MGLFRGDRLEPNPLLPDIADFDDIETFPCTALFWRAKAETISKHRNPLLLCLALGIGLHSIVADVLHCLNLGMFKDFCTNLCWEVMIGNAFSAPTHFGKELICEHNCRQLKQRLLAFYKYVGASHETRMQDLTVAMLGTDRHRSLKAKGAETKSFLHFFVSFLRAEGDSIQLNRPDVWRACGDALLGMVTCTKDQPWELPDAARQVLYEHYMRMRRLWEQLGLPFKPKLHQAAHLVSRIGQQFHAL